MSEFSKNLTRLSLERIIFALGFQNTSPALLASFADIVKHFVANLTERAMDSAELGGRSAASIHDFLHAINEFDMTWKSLDTFAFESESIAATAAIGGDTAASSSGSGSAADRKNVNSHRAKWDQPFPIFVSKYPLGSYDGRPKQKYNDDVIYGSSNKHDDLPKHVPPFPPSYTYQNVRPKRKRLNTEVENASIDAGSSKSKRIDSAVLKSLICIEDKVDREVGDTL